MKNSNSELVIYYNPASTIGRQTIAIAQMYNRHIKTYDFAKMDFTGTRWRELLFLLNLKPKQLLNKSDPWYQEKVRGHDWEEDDWLNVLIKNPFLIKAPIVLKGNRAILCHTPTDILKFI